jgi:hypothetical protein
MLNLRTTAYVMLGALLTFAIQAGVHSMTAPSRHEAIQAEMAWHKREQLFGLLQGTWLGHLEARCNMLTTGVLLDTDAYREEALLTMPLDCQQLLTLQVKHLQPELPRTGLNIGVFFGPGGVR